MSTIKNILNKIEIHPSCYFLLILSAFSADFLTVIIIVSLLFIHELGHFITAYFLDFETVKITFYPFGGISKFSHDINCPLKNEIMVLLMGPIVQLIFSFFLLKLPFFLSYNNLIIKINYNILFFNLLPIYPLDGGRILQCFLCYFISYNLGFKIIYIISTAILLILVSSFFLNPNLNLLLIIILLVIKLVIESKNIKYYFERFILERYLYKYNFKRSSIVKRTKDFKRDCTHLIKKGNKYLFEKEYLASIYNKKKS